MARDNIYIITIDFNNKGDKVLFKRKVGYKGSNNHKDEILITENLIEITANRSLKIDINDIFYKNNNSLYNQVLKTFSYYYCSVGSFYEIEKIKVERKLNTKKLDEQSLLKNEFKQIVSNDFKLKQKLKSRSLDLLFSKSVKGTQFFSSITYLIKSINSKDEFTKFEKLWKSFNPLYRMVGKKFLIWEKERPSERNFLTATKRFIGKNSKNFNNSIEMVSNKTSEELYSLLQWGNYINDTFTRKHKEDEYKKKVFEFTDHRVMHIFKKELKKVKKPSKNIGFYDEIDNHFDNHSKTIKDDEVLSIIVFNYLNFLRNKYFHGEKIDSSFRLIDNENIKEFKWLNQIFESFIYELINSIGTLNIIPKVKRVRK